MKLKMGKRRLAKRVLMAMLLLSALLVPACNNHAPDPITGLIVTFLPNPVPHNTSTFTAGSWTFLVYVTESRGVGVNITGYSRQDYSAAGVLYGVTEYTSTDFEADFRGCEGSSNQIAAGETRCSLWTISGGRNSGYEDWTFEGVDDNGNLVTGVGRVDFL